MTRYAYDAAGRLTAVTDPDGRTGQFMSVDPLVDQTRQPYAYAANNPLQNTDPSGACPVCFGVVIGAVVGAGGYMWQHRNDPSYDWGAVGMAAVKGGWIGGLATLSPRPARPWRPASASAPWAR